MPYGSKYLLRRYFTPPNCTLSAFPAATWIPRDGWTSWNFWRQKGSTKKRSISAPNIPPDQTHPPDRTGWACSLFRACSKMWIQCCSTLQQTTGVFYRLSGYDIYILFAVNRYYICIYVFTNTHAWVYTDICIHQCSIHWKFYTLPQKHW